MPETENPQKKQDHKAPGRKQMWALWAAVATALGSQGIPKIVELLENKPSVEQVQAMIAKQTEKLTVAQNTSVDAFKELNTTVVKLQDKCVEQRSRVDQLESKTGTMYDVMRDCCTRPKDQAKLDNPVPTVAGDSKEMTKVAEPAPLLPLVKEEKCVMKKEKALEKLEKVPAFDAQQQMQAPMP